MRNSEISPGESRPAILVAAIVTCKHRQRREFRQFSMNSARRGRNDFG
jgi:hypothetical protein